jgi:hypothetical protein
VTLTETEARTEAGAIVVQIMVARMGANEFETLAAKAYAEALDLGHDEIADELAWLFSARQN